MNPHVLLDTKTDLDHLRCLRRHMDLVLDTGRATFGPSPSRMWLASLDTRTGRYPADDTRPAHIPKRAYRNIDAPRGCSLYWDQPAIVAAHALSEVTGESVYREAAEDYVADFLERCVADNGLFVWGNHYYYDAFRSVAVRFGGDETPQPCDLACDPVELHECRPITPAWETFWRLDPEATEREIREMVRLHLADGETGMFNRHADCKRGCAFLEAGAVLIESLSWLYEKVGDPELIKVARSVAEFSFAHRDPVTGLMENNPTVGRWDKHTSTTEVGLWAGCLLRSARMTGEEQWVEMADVVVRAWMKYGYDAASGKFFGRLLVKTGEPDFSEPSSKFQPRDYVDLWRPQFPAHDYPMSFAEACLMLHEATGDAYYHEACRRWLGFIDRSLPANNGKGGYAEHYGRALHFAIACRDRFGDPLAGERVQRIAAEAHDMLWDQRMYRTHPGEHRYDAVDGVGYLMLALIRLHTGVEPDMLGTGW